MPPPAGRSGLRLRPAHMKDVKARNMAVPPHAGNRRKPMISRDPARMPGAGRAAQARVFLGTPAGPEELSGNITWGRKGRNASVRRRKSPLRIPRMITGQWTCVSRRAAKLENPGEECRPWRLQDPEPTAPAAVAGEDDVYGTRLSMTVRHANRERCRGRHHGRMVTETSSKKLVEEARDLAERLKFHTMRCTGFRSPASELIRIPYEEQLVSGARQRVSCAPGRSGWPASEPVMAAMASGYET